MAWCSRPALGNTTLLLFNGLYTRLSPKLTFWYIWDKTHFNYTLESQRKFWTKLSLPFVIKRKSATSRRCGRQFLGGTTPAGSDQGHHSGQIWLGPIEHFIIFSNKGKVGYFCPKLFQDLHYVIAMCFIYNMLKRQLWAPCARLPNVK